MVPKQEEGPQLLLVKGNKAKRRNPNRTEKNRYRKYPRIGITEQSVIDLHLIVKPIFTYFYVLYI